MFVFVALHVLFSYAMFFLLLYGFFDVGFSLLDLLEQSWVKSEQHRTQLSVSFFLLIKRSFQFIVVAWSVSVCVCFSPLHDSRCRFVWVKSQKLNSFHLQFTTWQAFFFFYLLTFFSSFSSFWWKSDWKSPLNTKWFCRLIDRKVVFFDFRSISFIEPVFFDWSKCREFSRNRMKNSWENLCQI